MKRIGPSILFIKKIEDKDLEIKQKHSDNISNRVQQLYTLGFEVSDTNLDIEIKNLKFDIDKFVFKFFIKRMKTKEIRSIQECDNLLKMLQSGDVNTAMLGIKLLFLETNLLKSLNLKKSDIANITTDADVINSVSSDYIDKRDVIIKLLFGKKANEFYLALMTNLPEIIQIENVAKTNLKQYLKCKSLLEKI